MPTKNPFLEASFARHQIDSARVKEVAVQIENLPSGEQMALAKAVHRLGARQLQKLLEKRAPVSREVQLPLDLAGAQPVGEVIYFGRLYRSLLKFRPAGEVAVPVTPPLSPMDRTFVRKSSKF